MGIFDFLHLHHILAPRFRLESRQTSDIHCDENSSMGLTSQISRLSRSVPTSFLEEPQKSSPEDFHESKPENDFVWFQMDFPLFFSGVYSQVNPPFIFLSVVVRGPELPKVWTTFSFAGLGEAAK